MEGELTHITIQLEEVRGAIEDINREDKQWETVEQWNKKDR